VLWSTRHGSSPIAATEEYTGIPKPIVKICSYEAHASMEMLGFLVCRIRPSRGVTVEDLVYFDNAATSFPKPDIVHDTVRDFYRENGVNPGRTGCDLALHALCAAVT